MTSTWNNAVIAVGLIVPLLSAGCSGGSPLTEETKRYITKDFIDPDAAQFRNIKPHGRCLTGEVNGKNRFGGYVGYHKFYYDPVTKSGAEEPEVISIIEITSEDYKKHNESVDSYLRNLGVCSKGEKGQEAFDASVRKRLAADKRAQ
ncbi:hypothetical protein [Novosphingobium soli]|uniref:Excinuclease ABC subunit A n=1 Tax=Novosphingobium soli TaxID=574956 RepID=A0ABV6CQD6_9SPHN